MRLKAKVKEGILNCVELRLAIMTALKIVDSRTLKTKLNSDDPELLRIDVLQVITDHLGIPQKLITEKTPKQPVR